jgi:hypothetical protein
MADIELIPTLTPADDPTLAPLAPPDSYDPNAERWVAERHNPHAERDELYQQTTLDPGYTVTEIDQYEPEDTDYTPAEIIASTLQMKPHLVGFPGVEHLDTAYTNYTPDMQEAGQVGINLTGAMVAAALGDVADAPLTRSTLREGPGILVGYMLTMNGAQTTKFMAIVDAINDDGPVIALINTAVPGNGFVGIGTHGIQFNRGLTLINLGTNPAVVIPVIKRNIPIHLGGK